MILFPKRVFRRLIDYCFFLSQSVCFFLYIFNVNDCWLLAYLYSVGCRCNCWMPSWIENDFQRKSAARYRTRPTRNRLSGRLSRSIDSFPLRTTGISRILRRSGDWLPGMTLRIRYWLVDESRAPRPNRQSREDEDQLPKASRTVAPIPPFSISAF